jgi:serine/threonine-protein phosphatase 2B catalytic subunit
MKAVGKMARNFNVLREKSEFLNEWKNLSGTKQLPSGFLASGADGIKQAVSSFEEARTTDKLNEHLPPLAETPKNK